MKCNGNRLCKACEEIKNGDDIRSTWSNEEAVMFHTLTEILPYLYHVLYTVFIV